MFKKKKKVFSNVLPWFPNWLNWLSFSLMDFMNVEMHMFMNHFFSDNLLSKRRKIRLSFLKSWSWMSACSYRQMCYWRSAFLSYWHGLHHRPENWKPDIDQLSCIYTVPREAFGKQIFLANCPTCLDRLYGYEKKLTMFSLY